MNRNKIHEFFEDNVKDEQLYRHSMRVATVASEIGKFIGMDKELLYNCGLLHDIGKVKGSNGLRHIYDGYVLLQNLDICDRYDICLTHSFPNKKIESYMGKNDCTYDEYLFIKNFIEKKTYDDYDKIIQLCDAIAGASGCKIIELSMIDVALKYNVNKNTVDSWKAYFDIYEEINKKIGRNVYSIITEDVKGYDYY